ncbi:MAG: hypothetical protein WDM88_05315 [Galbitalea sp.]
MRRLKVALVRGQVDIVGHDEPTTRVEVHSVSGKELRVALDGDSLEVDHPQLRWGQLHRRVPQLQWQRSRRC